MVLQLNDNWREKRAKGTLYGEIKTIGYEWHFSNVTRAGGIRIYHTLTEDCTWLHATAHAVHQDSHEELLFSLNTRITSQEDFDNIITQIHNRYVRG